MKQFFNNSKKNPKWTALAVLNAPTLFAEIKRFCFYVKATVTSNYDDKRMRVEIGRENLQLRWRDKCWLAQVFAHLVLFLRFIFCFCSLRLCFHLWLSRAESTVASGSSSTGAAGPDTFEPGLLSSVAWTENDKCLVFIEKQFLFVSRETQIVPFLLEICLISRRASNKTIQPPARLTVCPDCKT